MAENTLYELARQCASKDEYYFNDDANRLYPAFGLAKIAQQFKLRGIHESERKARLGKILHELADLTAQPEKEADWAIVGGLAQGIGGLGAGISAAAQTQANNRAVRERNAKRAVDAYNMHSIADNLDSILGKSRCDAHISSETVGRIGVRLSKTEELFRNLEFQCSFPENSSAGQLKGATIAYPKSDHGVDNQNVSISISNARGVRIDGYVSVVMKDSAQHPLWEKVIPLPMLGVGGVNETSTLIIGVPKAVKNLEFHPIALWELTDAGKKDTYVTGNIDDIPGGEEFMKTWQDNLTASSKRNETIIAKRKKSNFRIFAIASAVLAAIVLTFVFAIIGINNDSDFDIGCIISYSSPGQANDEYFSRLPRSYHERVADEYINNAKECVDLWKSAVEHLNYASRYAGTDAQLSEIQQLYVQAYIESNEEGLAEEYITRQYNAGSMDAAQVTAYAEQMYNFEPSYSYEDNCMRADALKVVNMVKHENEQAAQFSIEWDEGIKAHAAAVESFKSRDYAAALAFFADHTDVEHGWEYYGFSKAATDLFGTWKDDAGNTLVIGQDPNKEVEYWNAFGSASTASPEPYEMPLSIIYNGEDISYCKEKFWSQKTRQCMLSVNVYEYQGKVSSKLRYTDSLAGNPFMFAYDEESKTLTVTHQSEAYKSNGTIKSDVLWVGTFTRSQ